MRKLLLSLGVLLGSQLIYSQTVLLDENFDSYTNFAITGFGGWTTLDLDGRNTYTGGTATATWPNANLPQAFMIFNPSAAGVTNNTTATLADDEVRNFDPHSGAKYAACWNAVPGNGITANNDWLISPPVTLGTADNQLSLWVKSLSDTYGLEKYKIGIYVGTGNPTSSSNFTIITPGNYVTAPYTAWQQVTHNLDAYAGQTIRVGINCVSDDIYMLMVDDVRITTTSPLSVKEIRKEKSVNIYPNPTHGEVNIKTNKTIKLSIVTDISGKVLMQNKDSKQDLSKFPAGMYLLKIEFTDGSTTTEKIIKE